MRAAPARVSRGADAAACGLRTPCRPRGSPGVLERSPSGGARHSDPGRASRGDGTSSRRGLEGSTGGVRDAVSSADPRTRNLYFDVTATVTIQTSAEEAAFIAARLRQIGLQRIL